MSIVKEIQARFALAAPIVKPAAPSARTWRDRQAPLATREALQASASCKLWQALVGASLAGAV